MSESPKSPAGSGTERSSTPTPLPAGFHSPWDHPAARLVLPWDAPRDEWLAERRRGIGGSDTPALLGQSPYATRYDLWLDKTGQAEEFEGNAATGRGNWLEGPIADYFAEATGIDVCRVGLLASLERDHMRTTPDRFTADGGLLEIKTTTSYSEVAKEWRDDVARHAYIQGQQQLAVSGRSHAWFAADLGAGLPVIRGPYDRDEALIARIERSTDRFWFEHVVPNTPPPIDLTTITSGEIAHRWPSARAASSVEARYPSHVRLMLGERADLKVTTKAAETRLEEIDNALKVFVGNAEALTINDQPVLTYKNVKNKGYRRLYILADKDNAA